MRKPRCKALLDHLARRLGVVLLLALTTNRLQAGSESGNDPNAAALTLLGGNGNSKSFSWTDLRGGHVTIDVMNVSDECLTIQAKETWESDASVELTVNPAGEISIAPHEVKTFILTTPQAPDLWPSSYTAMVEIVGKDPQYLPLTVSLEATPFSLRPGVAKFYVIDTLSVLGGHWSTTVDVPVVSIPAGEPPEGSILGFLPGADGDALGIRWTTSHDPRLARFRIDPMKVGKFEGDLVFTEGRDTKRVVTLTVLGRHAWLWMALVTVAGIAMAALIQWYVSTLRMQWVMLAQIALAQRRLAALEAGQDFSAVKYRISEGVQSSCLELKKRVEAFLPALRRLRVRLIGLTTFLVHRVTNNKSGLVESPDVVDNATFYQQRMSDLATINLQIDAWEQLAKACVVLGAEVAEFDARLSQSQFSPPLGRALRGPLGPRCRSRAVELMEGNPVQVDPARLPATQKEVDDLSETLRRWEPLLAYLAETKKKIQSLRADSAMATHQDTFDELDGAIEQCASRLWSVESIEGIATIAPLIADIWAKVAVLHPPKQAVKKPALGGGQELELLVRTPSGEFFEPRTMAVKTAGAQVDRSVIQLVLPRVADSQQQVRFFVRALRVGDGAAALWSLLIALLAVTTQYYVGKPFGSGADYLAVFSVGASAKLAVDVFGFLINRFQNVAPAGVKGA